MAICTSPWLEGYLAAVLWHVMGSECAVLARFQACNGLHICRGTPQMHGTCKGARCDAI